MTKRCGYASCPTPDVLIEIHGQQRNRQFHYACAREVLKARQQARNSGVGSGRWRRPQPHVREPQPFQESPEAIERAFQQALAVIKARPRSEPVVGWSSPLARL